jgi:F-type H+-transporting ATPase subunit a
MTISLAAEKIPGLPITNAFLTGIIASLVIIVIISWLTWSIRRVPRKKQNFAEWMVEGFLNLVEGITGDHQKALKFLPLGLTFLIFILVNNWLGLLPGVGSIGFKEAVEGKEIFVPLFRSSNADLNTTLALALVSVVAIQWFGVGALGLKYFKKFLNFSNPIYFGIGILESISEMAKVISFSFRLFGNVFAGEVLLAVITGLIPLIAPLPFYGLEIFVGLIQALVFTILSLVFFQVATQEH